ncbi:SIMPL domain-containing protein [Bacillus sp. CGMCC 1.16541]|uniref:SIMPL domain-containing protein n=1 Tax=Bacillus sp. CGMCC 1.16541 TaxID=2185143 RepID=UPI000D73D7DB|nr:SIMPL domain-containing protein [Bacillus sp. CGMCC 1.16541]
MQPSFYPNYTPPPYHNQQRTQDRSVTVIGRGEVEAIPDTISLVIGVRTEDENVKDALQINSLTSTQMIEALNNNGISGDQIQTKSFTVNPKYDYSDGKTTLIGYEVQHLFTIKVKDVKQAGEVYDVAITNGANIAQDIQFSVSNPEPFYNEALREAILNAQEKAQTIAKTIQVTLNPFPTEIVESSQLRESSPKVFGLGSVSAAPPIQAQELTISAIVKVVYHY